MKGQAFPGRIFIDEKGPAIKASRIWGHWNTIWTDGSRLGSAPAGTAYAWRSPERWMGCRYHLGNNKEVFGAETYAILRELIFDRGQESGNCYTIFADSTAAINQIGPGQHLARAAIEACLHLVSRDNGVTVWATAHIGIAGNEEADRLAKEARGDAPTRCRVSTGGRPVSHLSRVATENRSRATA